MAADEKQPTNDDLAEIAGDLPDEVKINNKTTCPDCDVDDRGDNNNDGGDDDNGDDDFHGCDDCAQDIDDPGDAEGATDVLADIGEALADILAGILDENDELVDSKRFVRKLTRAVRRIKANPSVQDLLETRRRSIKKE